MDSENLGTKQIEKILSAEIRDWLRWGRGKDYLPVSFRCPLGFLYVRPRGDLDIGRYRAPPINLLAVVEFERIVVALPAKHRQAFVMYHLNRIAINEKIEEKKYTYSEMARLLSLQKTQFYTVLGQAHSMVFRNWKAKHV